MQNLSSTHCESGASSPFVKLLYEKTENVNNHSNILYELLKELSMQREILHSIMESEQQAHSRERCEHSQWHNDNANEKVNGNKNKNICYEEHLRYKSDDNKISSQNCLMHEPHSLERTEELLETKRHSVWRENDSLAVEKNEERSNGYHGKEEKQLQNSNAEYISNLPEHKANMTVANTTSNIPESSLWGEEVSALTEDSPSPNRPLELSSHYTHRELLLSPLPLDFTEISKSNNNYNDSSNEVNDKKYTLEEKDAEESEINRNTTNGRMLPNTHSFFGSNNNKIDSETINIDAEMTETSEPLLQEEATEMNKEEIARNVISKSETGVKLNELTDNDEIEQSRSAQPSLHIIEQQSCSERRDANCNVTEKYGLHKCDIRENDNDANYGNTNKRYDTCYTYFYTKQQFAE